MVKVGVRELKNSLSRILALVKKGEVVQVSEWGEAVALLIPASSPSEEEGLRRIVASGAVSWAGGKPEGAKVRIPSKVAKKAFGGKLASEWIIENRR